jgi:hypothetical protein
MYATIKNVSSTLARAASPNAVLALLIVFPSLLNVSSLSVLCFPLLFPKPWQNNTLSLLRAFSQGRAPLQNRRRNTISEVLHPTKLFKFQQTRVASGRMCSFQEGLGMGFPLELQ